MSRYLLTLFGACFLAGCDAAADVRVLPLPALNQPSPEARLGLPEISGSWRFAGWEILRGDSTSLGRTFPSFGELRIDTQRLDSIAGTFTLAGGPTAIAGNVTRDGHVTVVTLPGGVPASFIAGSVARDTLWLELTSVLVPDEWPPDSRAAFVRGPAAEPISWLRGFNPAFLPPTTPVDTLGTSPALISDTVPPGGIPAGVPVGSGGETNQIRPSTVPARSQTQPPGSGSQVRPPTTSQPSANPGRGQVAPQSPRQQTPSTPAQGARAPSGQPATQRNPAGPPPRDQPDRPDPDPDADQPLLGDPLVE